MILKHMDSIRRVLSVTAFVVALILLTGTPAKVREVTLKEDAPVSEEEIRETHPDLVMLPKPARQVRCRWRRP
jgi:hypothetical protein